MPEDETLQIPEFPPLRDGIPVGYKPGNRWRFEVAREEAVSYEDDREEDAPEEFWVVTVRTLEGPERKGELWFAKADLVLSKVVLDPGSRRERTHWLEGTAQTDSGPAAALGVPLQWPDLVAAKKPKAEVVTGRRDKVLQRVTVSDEGTEKEEHRLLLAKKSSKRDKKEIQQAKFTWRAGDPYWTRLWTRDGLAVLRRRKER
jgi:hypothetical protein